MTLQRAWMVVLAVLVGLLTPCTTTSSSAVFTYDGLAVARVVQRSVGAVDTGTALLDESREGSASSALTAGAWSTTPSTTFVATEGGSMFSSGSAMSNAEVVESGAGLPRTAGTVSDVAGRAGVDLGGSTVRIIEDPEYLRYLDSQGACACAPYDLPGEIHVGPASFIDEQTLAATLAHEQAHILQYGAGYVPGSGGLEAMEAAARAAEGPAVARLMGWAP